MSRFFIRLLNLALMACFLGCVVGGWYLSKQGFGKKWRKKLTEEFALRGVQMTARRLTLDPLRGLVARNVEVYSDAKQNQVVAKIDELRLDIDYTRLLRKEPFLDGLSLSEAEVNLDLDPRRANSGEFQVQHLEARFYFAPDHVEVRRFEGRGLGFWFSISGTLDHGPNWQISTDPTQFWKRLTSIPAPWLQRLKAVKFGSRAGRLDLRFHGNLAQRRWLRSADLRMECSRVRWQGVEFRDMKAEADFGNEALTLRRLTWHDDRGPASITGTWQPGLEGNLQIDSQLDGTPIFQQIDPLANLAVVGPMHVSANFSWTENPALDWRALGKLNFSDVLFRGVKWDWLQTQFSVSPSRWLLQETQLSQKSGVIFGQLMKDEGQIKVALTSTADPQAIWQSLAIFVPPVLRDAEFPVNPLIKISLSGPFAEPAKWQADGEITLGRTHFRGVALTSGQASFSALGTTLSLSQLQITRPEGQLTGTAFWDSAKGDLLFWNVKNSIDPVALGLWTDNSLGEVIETMRYGKGAEMEGQGRISWRNEKFTSAQLHLTANLANPFDPPVMQKLVKSLAGDDAPEKLQAEVWVEKGLLRIVPLVITGKNWQLEGEPVWNLSEKQFSGVMRWSQTGGESSIWKASSPWNQVIWKREP